MNQSDKRQGILENVKAWADREYQYKNLQSGIDYIPASGKVLGASELVNIVDAALDGWLTTGRFNDQFESLLGQFIDCEHILTVNSGSSANLLAFQALTSPHLGERQIKPGDEVITVAAAFPTTVNPIVLSGAIPVFVDIDPFTLNVNVEQLQQAYSNKTKAVMFAHTLGNPFDLAAVKAFCEKHQLWLVEDCCDALGATYNGSHVGTSADIATLSFYPAHQITTGEGGAVFSNNKDLIRIVQSLRDWGRDCFCPPGKENTCQSRFCQQQGELPYGYDHKYIYSHLGYNMKMTDMQAACGVSQIARLPDFIQKRRENFSYLAKGLEPIGKYIDVMQDTPNSSPCYFGFPITLKPEANFDRVHLQEYLEQNLIGSRLLFAGNLIKQPYFKTIKFRVGADLNQTNNIMMNTLWVGVHPGLNQVQLDYILVKLKNLFGEF